MKQADQQGYFPQITVSSKPGYLKLNFAKRYRQNSTYDRQRRILDMTVVQCSSIEIGEHRNT